MFQHLIIKAQTDGIERLNVAAVLFNDQGKMLIAQRSATKKYLPNVWHIPGGQIDTGETVEEALRREVKEEFNLEISEVVADTEIVHDYLGHGDQKSRTLFIVAKSQGEITLDHENQAYKYIDKSEINEYLEPFVQEVNHQVFDAAIKITTIQS
jgi:8-oxo-dGTP diphosphatase